MGRQGPYFAATQPDPLDVRAEDPAEAWRSFKEDFEIFATVSRLAEEAPAEKRAVLLLGKEARR